MYFTYIIKSDKSGRYYVGSTDNVSNRLKRHNSSRNKSTKTGIPWSLIHQEEFQTREEAYRREIQIKSYKSGEAFKKLINKK